MGWRDWLRPGPLRDRLGTAGVQTVAALSAAVVVLIGAAPMAAASADPNADPIIAQSIAGDTPPVNLPAPGFRLVDQDGTAVSLASLRGKVVLMTFLDPVCTSDCPLIAQEFKDAWRLLGAQSRRVELVAVVANPTYLSTEFTRAFDQQEGLTTVRDWLYLTGTLPQLKKVWDDYGVTVENLPAGAMSAHDDIAVVIDRAGHIRYELSSTWSRHYQQQVLVRRAARGLRPAGTGQLMSISPAARQCAALTCALLLAAAVTGCGSAITPPEVTSSRATEAAVALATTVTTASGVWAVVVMGGSAAQENNFWQLFTVPARGSRWSLVTPPAVADNGGLVTAADSGGTSQLRVAFRPSQSLTFSPLASTADGGHTWTTGLLDAPIAAAPDALAARGTTMVALLTNGTIERSASGGASWSTFARPGAIAASAAGNRCQVTALTAISLTSSGTPLAGAACSAKGSPGIFAYTQGSWRGTGPALTGSLASQPVRVLRLTGTAAGNTALLMAGTGSHARLYATWTSDGRSLDHLATVQMHWAQGPGLRHLGEEASHGSCSPTARRDHQRPERVLAEPARPARRDHSAGHPARRSYRRARRQGEQPDLFQLTGTPGTWSKTQEIKVPIQYGSSG